MCRFLQGEKKQGPRSAANKIDIITSFLKAHGITGVIRTEDRPRYTEEEARGVGWVFEASSEEEYVWFNFFLMTGEVCFTFRP